MSAEPKLISLRWEGTCATCGMGCPSGVEAWWDPDGKTVRCRPCVEGAELALKHAGTPGGSAIAEGRRRQEKRRERLRSRIGRLAPVVETLTSDPQSTTSWLVGGASEERVGAYLERELAGTAIVLHDLRKPRSKANIDHVIVARSGIWVVDSKLRNGRVRWRDVGPLWRTELRLEVGGRDRTKLVHAMAGQAEVVADALAARTSELPIRPVLCFNEASWGIFPKAFGINGVLVTFPGDLIERVRKADGPLDDAVIGWSAARVALALRPSEVS